jgi:hypothetical protein
MAQLAPHRRLINLATQRAAQHATAVQQACE